MGKSKKKHHKKPKEEPVEEPTVEEPTVEDPIIEDKLEEDDIDLEETIKKTSKTKSICKSILRFLGSNFGLFIVLV